VERQKRFNANTSVSVSRCGVMIILCLDIVPPSVHSPPAKTLGTDHRKMMCAVYHEACNFP
jgi:hypothetical protein